MKSLPHPEWPTSVSLYCNRPDDHREHGTNGTIIMWWKQMVISQHIDEPRYLQEYHDTTMMVLPWDLILSGALHSDFGVNRHEFQSKWCPFRSRTVICSPSPSPVSTPWGNTWKVSLPSPKRCAHCLKQPRKDTQETSVNALAVQTMASWIHAWNLPNNDLN